MGADLDLIVSRLRQNKVKEYEIYLQQPKSFQLYLRRNKKELIQKNENVGFSLRVHDGGMGFAVSDFLTKNSIDNLIKNSVSMARTSKPVQFQFPKQRASKNVKTVDKRLKLGEAEKHLEDFASQMVDIAKENNVEISFAKLKAFDMKTQIRNSEDLFKEKLETYFFLETSIKTSSSEFWTMRYARNLDDLPIDKISEWINLAKQSERGMEPKTEKTTVIFDPSIMVDLLTSVFNFHTAASSLKKKVTLFTPKKVFADRSVTILDDSLHPFGLMTSSFDDEGVPQQRTTIIEKGVFKNFLYDQTYGIAFERKSTGNGLRQRDTFYSTDDKYSLRPSEQAANLMVMPGKKSLDALVEEVKHGLIIYKFSWLNPKEESGTFSSEIRNAAYIENGQITKSVKGGLISGNIFDMLKNVSGISKDPEIVSGASSFSGIMPFVRFENVQVAGK
ncbi:MAG: TldD/PmbA family protein [Candidatus Aenigmatarchaeota archaeon]